MAETVTIEGQEYLKRNPLGVLGLTFITLGIYGLYWYYKANDEIRRFEHDDTISPTRSLLALFPGGIIIVPAIIAVWNTANHVVKMQDRIRVESPISPAITVVLLLLIAIALGLYVQEHLNRVWDKAAGPQTPMTPPAAPEPPPPPAT